MTHSFSHLQETVSSTLVAGIAAVNGSASPMNAMFTEMMAHKLPRIQRHCGGMRRAKEGGKLRK